MDLAQSMETLSVVDPAPGGAPPLTLALPAHAPRFGAVAAETHLAPHHFAALFEVIADRISARKFTWSPLHPHWLRLWAGAEPTWHVNLKRVEFTFDCAYANRASRDAGVRTALDALHSVKQDLATCEAAFADLISAEQTIRWHASKQSYDDAVPCEYCQRYGAT